MGVNVMAVASPILDAAFSILADGKPRSASEILTEAQQRGLLDANETTKLVQNALSQFIQRALAHERKPTVIKDLDGRFRINRPIDDWPAFDATGLAPLAPPDALPAHAAAVIASLQNAGRGTDPDAFETAVCSTFELFGFVANHLGGHAAPDGYADAPLGELRYRLMIECKIGRTDSISASNAPAEAAKFRDAYRADYCALVAPAFDSVVTFASELQTHGVAAWTTDDLFRAARLRLDCSKMRGLFAPGFAADALDDLAWENVHGSLRRLRVVTSLVMKVGLTQQQLALEVGNGASTPRLTRDVALSLLDDHLKTAGSTQGARIDEIDAAFSWLTNPLVGKAIWTDDTHTAIVIRPSLPLSP